MLTLSGKLVDIQTNVAEPTCIFSVSNNAHLPAVLRKDKAFLVENDKIPPGFSHYLIFERNKDLLANLPKKEDFSILPDSFNYLGDEDIIRISPDRKSIRALYRASSVHNGFLVTEQCNHYCLMCSQPPKRIDDSWILDEIEKIIPLIPKTAPEIGFTGGEPTLYGDRFINILEMMKSYLPRTAIHILSNGRRFSDITYARKYAHVQHPDMMVGIPLYADDPILHDYIVQAKGAFDETIRGILNLKRFSQKVEIRIVIHKQSIKRLSQLAEFITRNLQFVNHVALMGLEMTGFTRANLDELWIDPYEYRNTLSSAVNVLSSYGVPVSVYNHQLCTINPDTYKFCRKSISDWKNEYVNECAGCEKMNQCGGFFSSSVLYKYSNHIAPFISQQKNM